MRLVALTLALVLGAGLLLWLLQSSGGAAEAARAQPSIALRPTGPGDEALMERVAQLELSLDELRGDLRMLTESHTSSLTRRPELERPVPDSTGTEVSAERTPQWYLDRYVESFRQGGEGSEYFRLAVEAFAPTLQTQLIALVKSAGTQPVLRRRLIGILGTPPFRGSGTVQDALLFVLRTGDELALLQSALAAFGAIGDERSAGALEGLVWQMPFEQIQLELLQAVVRLSGEGANAALVRLLRTAPAEMQALVIALLQPSDHESALYALRLASQSDVPLRLQAADMLPRFRSEAFTAFARDWLATEGDANVRRKLEDALEALAQLPAYHPEKATGAPDADPGRDHPNAWATLATDQGAEWLELGYATPLRANLVRIHEVNVPGAVVALIGIDESGAREPLWQGDDPLIEPGVFEVTFPTTARPLTGVRIVLDTKRRSGWNEIDAVELVGPDGRAWASSARASSSYADR